MYGALFKDTTLQELDILTERNDIGGGSSLQQLLDQATYQHFQEQMASICIEAGALHRIADHVEQKGYRSVQLVADEHTYAAAGKELVLILGKKGFQAFTTCVAANSIGDVIADEAAIVQVLLDIQHNHADVVVAVGGGTLHDIARYAAYTSRLSFISVPTAPSVDGFNSKGAPIIIRGYKQTIISIGPEAVFADLNVLVKAPQPMIAAGFGDILGKYTSLFDWKFGAITSGEPYSLASELITRHALQHSVSCAGQIAKRDEEGIALLTRALMESGVAMLLFGHSHPASGAEHHLSHYWEMEYLKHGEKQLLHGAKVGCATIEIAKLYKQLQEQDWGLQAKLNSNIASHWDEIKQHISAIPAADELSALLAQVGGPTSYHQLGIAQELVARSMSEAHLVRPERYTLLHAYNMETGHMNSRSGA